MIQQTPVIQPETEGAAQTPDSTEPFAHTPDNSRLLPALNLAAEVADRYDLDALSGLIARARALAAGAEISVAVLGRFKAGKSSSLNHF